MPASPQVTIENVNCPGQTTNVDAEKYAAMKEVLLTVLPEAAPGLSQKEMQQAILPHFPEHLWPGGEKSGWWAKTVQLDLEAKQLITRTDTKPLTWHRV